MNEATPDDSANSGPSDTPPSGNSTKRIPSAEQIVSYGFKLLIVCLLIYVPVRLSPLQVPITQEDSLFRQTFDDLTDAAIEIDSISPCADVIGRGRINRTCSFALLSENTYMRCAEGTNGLPSSAQGPTANEECSGRSQIWLRLREIAKDLDRVTVRHQVDVNFERYLTPRGRDIYKARKSEMLGAIAAQRQQITTLMICFTASPGGTCPYPLNSVALVEALEAAGSARQFHLRDPLLVWLGEYFSTS